MSEVTGRLQAFGQRLAEDGYPSALVEQAVTRMDAMENEIVRQAKRIEQLEGALQEIANTPPVHPLAMGCAAIARAALQDKGSE